MTSKIEQAIKDIEDYIDSCKPQAFSSARIIVNKDDMDELLRELKLCTPEEIKRYQKVLNNRDAIIADAESKAQELINQATDKTTQLVSDHEIMQQAYAQANDVVSMAVEEAQNILDNATVDANNLRISAMQYMDDMLSDLGDLIEAALTTADSDYAALMGNLQNDYTTLMNNLQAGHHDLISGLTHYRDVVASNRAELNSPPPNTAAQNMETSGQAASSQADTAETTVIHKTKGDLDLIK